MAACAGAAQTSATYPFEGIQPYAKGNFPSFSVFLLSCTKSERDLAQKIKKQLIQAKQVGSTAKSMAAWWSSISTSRNVAMEHGIEHIRGKEGEGDFL